MQIVHIALGGLIKAPPIAYGATEDTGGHIAYVLGAATAQAARPGHHVRILTRRFEDKGEPYDAPVERLGTRLAIHRIDHGRPVYAEKDALEAQLPAIAEAVERMLRAGPRPDVIHAHFADAAEVAAPAARALGVPVLYHAHSLGIDKRATCGGGPRLRTRIARENAAIRSAAAVIASSRDEAERQLTLYPGARPARIHRVMPGIPAPAVDHARARRLVAPMLRAPDRPAVVAVARPVGKKNLARLVDLYAETPGLAKRANLVIVAGLRGADLGGEAARVNAAIEARVEAHGLWGKVALPAMHAAADVPALLSWAAAGRGVFANPARTEPFGLTLVEAAAAGLPIVATHHGGPADILSLLRHGAVADPDGPAFGTALLHLLTDRAAWDEAHRAARANAPDWTWDRWAAGVDRVIRALRAPAKAPPAQRLLVSDIDATLTGSAAGARRFGLWRRSAPEWRVALATGRSLAEARFVLARWDLPEPDAYASSVGTEIYLHGPDGLTRDDGYSQMIAEGWDRAGLLSALSDLPGLAPQAPIEFREFKLSYLGDARAAARARAAIAAAGLAAHVVHSHDRLIDVLPPRAGKAAAMRRLADRLGVPRHAVLAAGDSGNDADLLREAPRAVAVANASEELAELAGPHLLRARAPHADGVLEAIRGAP